VVIRDRNTLPRCARDGLKNHHSEAKFSALLQFCKWLLIVNFLFMMKTSTFWGVMYHDFITQPATYREW
jgi:hypothetical protein